jgi:predicted transcriptional regulator
VKDNPENDYPMRKKKSRHLLTEVELEFMSELWALGEGSVRDVLASLPEDRNLAYTSGATILRILEEKGFVASRKEGKSLIYKPLLAKDTYQTRSLQNLSRTLFDDTPATLVARLVDDAGLTEADLEEIRALVERRLHDDSDENGS